MRTFNFALPALVAAAVFAAPLSAQYAQPETESDKNIVEVAAEAGTFTTLLAAAEAAGLVEVLSGEGPLTVFAPTDEAFAKLPEGTVEALLEDTDALRAILTYHVVPGRVMAADVVQLERAQTVQGAYVQIRTYGESVRINDATVVAADVEASNGVIHVIDTVILPPSN